MVDKTTLAVAGQCPVAVLEAVGKTRIRDYYRNEATGIGYYAPSLDGKTADLSTIQGSLPSLRWGHNGRLLTTEQKILHELEQMVIRAGDDIGLTFGNARRLPVKAIELAWHVKVDISTVIMIHWHKRHPLIRNKTVCHRDETICFPGTNLKIGFYEAARKRAAKRVSSSNYAPRSHLQK
jgi:hypothetical protein